MKAADLDRMVARAIPARRATLEQRIGQLAHVAGGVGVQGRLAQLESIGEFLSGGERERVWTVIACLTARLPTPEDVVEASRLVALDGPWVYLRALMFPRGAARLMIRRGRPIEIVRGATLVDVDHTSRVAFATGIQRVVRETTRRWDEKHDVILVGWSRDRTSLRRLGTAERDVALTGSSSSPATPLGWHGGISLIPIDSTYIAAELNIEARSVRRIAGLAEHSRNHTAAIGFDQVPITSAETTDGGMPPAFALTLAAVKWMDAVAAISDAAAEEYLGWREMLRAIGIAGPDVSSITLPLYGESTVTPGDLNDVRAALGLGTTPLVLCVGSHEPRKNHLAVLHAAELLWRDGINFRLVFVGGNSWNSSEFESRVETMTATGRDLLTVKALPDRLLWAAYQDSYVVLFPSLNEGYGLPVAEALASGTPVITSKFGSTAQIAAQGGAVLVDPRNDDQIVAAMRAVLTNAEYREQLALQTRTVTRRSWDDYAEAVWQHLAAPRL